MMRFPLLCLLALLSGSDRLAAQGSVEARGITSAIKLEEVVYGHLHEINGKFKMRATEVTFAPNAYLGVHHHVGPANPVCACRRGRVHGRRADDNL